MNTNICDKWLKNKKINPMTNKPIKENGPTYRKFEQLCILKNRVSADIDTRINYYLIVKNYIDKIKLKHKNNCVKFYKLSDNEIQYSVGSNIILNKRLGKGSYGVVYKSYFRPKQITEREYGKQFEIVVKICEITSANKLEIDILSNLTQLVIKKVCPHFPISYGYLICNKYNKISFSSNSIPSSAQSSRILDENSKLFYNSSSESTNFLEKPNIYLQINEYASNKTFARIISRYNNALNINIIIQSFISIVFFQKYMNMAHRDTHGNNFLCHIINPGGYYHYRIYNKDYYLENIGYLIVINDFGLVRELNKNTLLYDFTKFIKSFIKHDAGYPELTHIVDFMKNLIIGFKTTITDSNIQYAFYSHLFKFVNETFPQYLLINKPTDAIIINKTPYIIE